MSHYSVLETEFRYKDSLVRALEQIYGEGNVEVYDDPVTLYDYVGRARPQKANVVVRRKHISSLSNDLGFIKESSVYKMIVSDYDRRAGLVNKDRIVKKYVYDVLQHKLPKHKYKVKSTSNNKIVLEVRA